MCKEKIIEFIEDLLKSDNMATLNNSPEQLLTKFKTYIVKAAKIITEKEVRHSPDWITQDEKILSIYLNIRNKAQRE